MRTAIELVGLPGAGKTTIAHCIAKRLRHGSVSANAVTLQCAAGAANSCRRNKLMSVAWHTLFDPKAAVGLWLLALRTRPGVFRAARWVGNALQVQHRTAPSEYLIWDQGAAQLLWALFFWSNVRPDHSRICRYLSWAYSDQTSTDRYIIIVRCSTETLRSRLLGRPAHARLGLEQEFVMSHGLECHEKVNDVMRRFVRSGGPVQLLAVDGELPADVVADHICKRIAWHSGRSPADKTTASVSNTLKPPGGRSA